MIATPTLSVVNGLRIMQVENRVLVASRSEEGRWWDVTAGLCGCKGFEHRGRCAHLTATATLHQPIAITVEPEDEAIPYWPLDGETPDLTPLCPRCHAEETNRRHPDGLGNACISRELFGEEV